MFNVGSFQPQTKNEMSILRSLRLIVLELKQQESTLSRIKGRNRTPTGSGQCENIHHELFTPEMLTSTGTSSGSDNFPNGFETRFLQMDDENAYVNCGCQIPRLWDGGPVTVHAALYLAVGSSLSTHDFGVGLRAVADGESLDNVIAETATISADMELLDVLKIASGTVDIQSSPAPLDFVQFRFARTDNESGDPRLIHIVLEFNLRCKESDPLLEVPLTGPLSPVLEFVEDIGGGQYRAHFGYINDMIQVVPVGDGPPSNKFSGGGLGGPDIGQPTNFSNPFRTVDIFQIVFDGTDLVWTLNGSTATANAGQAP